MLTPEECEREVREAWERVLVCDGSYRSYPRGTILINWDNNQFYDFPDYFAAKQFTDRRKQEIAKIEDAIEEVTDWRETYTEAKYESHSCDFILIHLESAFAELKKGMKL